MTAAARFKPSAKDLREHVARAASYWVRPEHYEFTEPPHPKITAYRVWDNIADKSVALFPTPEEAGEHCHILNARAAIRAVLEGIMEPKVDVQLEGIKAWRGSQVGDSAMLDAWQAMIRQLLDENK